MKAQLHELWNFCLSTLILKPTIHTIHSYIFWWKYICFYGNVAANEVVYIYMYFKFLILKATNAFVLAQLQHFHIDLMLMFSFTTSGIWFILHNVHVTVQPLCPYVQIFYFPSNESKYYWTSSQANLLVIVPSLQQVETLILARSFLSLLNLSTLIYIAPIIICLFRVLLKINTNFNTLTNKYN